LDDYKKVNNATTSLSYLEIEMGSAKAGARAKPTITPALPNLHQRHNPQGKV
jgi:hypothetical protein